ncbi:MAG TPA: DUF805 domain-containing protein [Xanthobacteraceae bacterium]|nr:DUF805 domain-containing protein [Xanthobacteraceae bacterium]
MNFGQAITSGFSNYVNFSDRAIRSEYWYWFLFVVLCQIATMIIDSVIGVQLTTSILSLAVLLPGIAVGVRRLHDLDRTGWWLLLGLVPLIGAIVLIVWFCTRGTPGPNRFGADPLTGFGQISPRPAA